MEITVERTNEAIVIKLPLDTDISDIQNVLNYFEYVNLVSKSEATQEGIDRLAKEAKSGWWEENKERFKGVAGFEDIVE
jgi:post-segregation antitoxin (ccd killing protein)